MKKIGLIFVATAVLMMGFLSCDTNGNGDVVVTPPTGITVTSDSATIAQDYTVEMYVDDTRHFTVAATGATSFAWTVVSGGAYVTLTNANTATVTIAADAEGTAQIRATATNADGSITREFYVEVKEDAVTPDPLSVTVTGVTADTPVIISLTLTAGQEFTAVATGGTTPHEFAWTADATGVVTLTNANTATVTITPIAVGTREITVTVTDDEGEKDDFTFTVQVTAAPAPIVVGVTGVTEGQEIFMPNALTEGRQFTATASGGMPPFTFSWEAAPAGVVTLANDNTSTVTITPATPATAGTAIITVTATDDEGETEDFYFEVNVGDPIPIRFRERGPAAQQIDRPDIDSSAVYEGAVSVSVPSVGSSREINGRISATPGVTYLWETSDPAVASVHQITSAAIVTNQDTFVIVTGTGVGSAEITLTVTAPDGRVGVRSFTFIVGNDAFDPDWHPFASRLITNLVVRDNGVNNNATFVVPNNLGDFFPHKQFVQNDPVTDFRLRDYWSIRPDIRAGRRVYVERTQTFSNNPATNTFTPIPLELEGSDWIRGPHARRDQADATRRADHMEFRALVNIYVYIVHDSRANMPHADRQWIEWYLDSPDWVLQPGMYVLSGESIGSTDTLPASHGGVMHVRRQSFNAGELVQLGGSRPSGINVHFFVVRPRG